MKNEPIFALDIGTRSVTGILLEEHGSNYTLIDYCVKEHKVRSMLDGQIHNVVEVAEIIREVKEALEKSSGTLHKVCVAAAGRSLKTVVSQATIELNQKPISDFETIKHLELSAVHTAQLKVASESASDFSNYYCVGYSVLYYKIDEENIGSLIDQSGQTATVEVIATFLPKVVVESLISALNRAGLEMEALTLEPIAAIQVLIPESMRRLNVALVDIGAGTSDIAITNSGTISAYGMVPIAGDEITEAVSDQYLLDFPLAEETKRTIVNTGKAIVADILGFESTITYEDLVQRVDDSINKLASSISEEILRLNGAQPKAVMLIGGGSQTPEFTKRLANKLQLPENRVAIRDIQAIQSLDKTENLPQGPDFVTPIGIAIAAKQNPVHYISVKVNQKVIRMFEMKQLTIGDCLVHAGIEINKLYGKPGLAKVITLNGKQITLPGNFGKAPTLLLNQEQATVETNIQNGDEIVIKKGMDGEQPTLTLEELIGEVPTIVIHFNGKPYELKTQYYVNNSLQQKEYMVCDRDEIVLTTPKTIKEFLSSISGIKLPTNEEFIVFVNNKPVNLGLAESTLTVNGKATSLEYKLRANDDLRITTDNTVTVKEVIEKLQIDLYTELHVSFNHEKITMKQPKVAIKRNNVILTEDTILYPSDRLSLEEKKQEMFIFQDVFRYVDIDLTQANGKFTLTKNDLPTTFYEPIEAGDRLAIIWN